MPEKPSPCLRPNTALPVNTGSIAVSRSVDDLDGLRSYLNPSPLRLSS